MLTLNNTWHDNLATLCWEQTASSTLKRSSLLTYCWRLSFLYLIFISLPCVLALPTGPPLPTGRRVLRAGGFCQSSTSVRQKVLFLYQTQEYKLIIWGLMWEDVNWNNDSQQINLYRTMLRGFQRLDIKDSFATVVWEGALLFIQNERCVIHLNCAPPQASPPPLFPGAHGSRCEGSVSSGQLLQSSVLLHRRVRSPCEGEGHPVRLCFRWVSFMPQWVLCLNLRDRKSGV